MTDVAIEYAEALFMIASENNCLDEYKEKLGIIRDAVCESPEITDILDSPAVLLSERLSVVDTIFGAEMPEYIVSFLKILCENRYAKHIERIISEFFELARDAENRARAVVYYVEPLTDAQKAALIEKLEKISKKTVDADYVEDKSLIGGIKVVLDDKLLDGSVSGRLSKIKGVIGK
jgi:F-type H+-transporting ATPase subunit delta